MIPVVVKNIVEEAHNVVRLVLGSRDGSELPAFEAGAHIDLHLPSGLIRQYSLCRLQVEPQYYEVAVLKDPQSRGGSEEVHRLTIGNELAVSAPRNHFSLVDSPRHSVLIAGGIGVTPLLPMAQQLQKQGRSFEFHYCAKTPEKAAFSASLKTASFADKMAFHFSQQADSGRMDMVSVLSRHASDSELYVCGPADFINDVLSQARMQGWAEERLHREFFAAPDPSEDESDNAAFQVKIQSTGELIDVSEHQTMYEALDNHGVFLAVSCESGVCGTCQTGVVSGTPDHRDVFLTEAERQQGKWVMPCCSRSKTKILELDL
ncbi:PDR/VanB family oxidoreductase [Marinomonas posidonica]|uniref:Phthalate 4,5-dioxygenase n=1 Tax=Marinomonas posidonica (strain CECT 7376 / NCIMB 14433 / IVIA-Po-181) TaxID=491952 RepID=F6CY07_MARPP|nr:PDR/VanB family oxidoreductase [Marinomonas posidonica]AEF55639.1 Phthalate 4,5-dioxygenase [Marinomonas posidonica IVIA-Po-181]